MFYDILKSGNSLIIGENERFLVSSGSDGIKRFMTKFKDNYLNEMINQVLGPDLSDNQWEKVD